MPLPTTYRMGPGTLKLGEAGVKDISIQLTAFTVSAAENVQSTDAIPVLTGDELPAEEIVTHTWQVAGNVLQDISAAGVVTYTWDNKGEVLDFEFIPNTAAGRKVTGVLRVIPLDLGGEAKSRPRADFTWRAGGAFADGLISGDPVLANVA